ncbi:aa3-type cytochrome c oxidase subunit IV [Mesorhizobium sp. CAU 1741]|uniref:aa3-type cytochrome c oxidase subunit IV n=1 Tax=Mesorhizobium sp. CAU 1741 TaxID=3140366 RepID=UPI00325C0A3C
MADNTPTGPVELGAEMDYQEHEKTYSLFIGLSKYVTLSTVALLIAMAFGFFTSAGFFSAFILFVLINLVGAYLLR